MVYWNIPRKCPCSDECHCPIFRLSQHFEFSERKPGKCLTPNFNHSVMEGHGKHVTSHTCFSQTSFLITALYIACVGHFSTPLGSGNLSEAVDIAIIDSFMDHSARDRTRVYPWFHKKYLHTFGIMKLVFYANKYGSTTTFFSHILGRPRLLADTNIS